MRSRKSDARVANTYRRELLRGLSCWLSQRGGLKARSHQVLSRQQADLRLTNQALEGSALGISTFIKRQQEKTRQSRLSPPPTEGTSSLEAEGRRQFSS